MPKPILTLTTDFGLSDHYVGAMKGVILGICPQAQIVDISHEVSPFGVAEGAYVIEQAYRYYPNKTVHVVVVDPGVGSARRPILVEAAGQVFIAPDNGVLGMILARKQHKVRVLSNGRYFLKSVSQTFHGRDIFSPVAAHVAAGVKPAQMGKRVDDYVRPEFASPVRTGEHAWTGRILKIDHFGNIITNFYAADHPGLESGRFSLGIGSHRTGRLARSYAESAPGELFVIAGSGGYLEVSLNQGSAASMIGCNGGVAVDLVL
ncbi:MAG TPA: SAM-dependent chlorinase/fluorinase [Bryobacteraceae bacterium]